MIDVFLDSLIDSVKVLGIAFVIYFILSFLEGRISRIFERHKNASPIIGAACGLVPQCGISVVGADLYQKQRITVGTLLAIFFACSDEALPLLLSNVNKIWSVIPLLLIKFIFGFILGYSVDFFIRHKELKEIHNESIHIGCCNHEIDNEMESPIHCHFIHPLIHSIKIWIYVFIISFLFGTIIFYVGEESIQLFLQSNKYLGPLFAGVIGLIPNCASSVMITQLFLMDGLAFGALVTGLCVNAGIGLIYLMKFKEKRITALKIMGVLFMYSLILGYIVMLIQELL